MKLEFREVKNSPKVKKYIYSGPKLSNLRSSNFFCSPVTVP